MSKLVHFKCYDIVGILISWTFLQIALAVPTKFLPKLQQADMTIDINSTHIIML